MKKQNALTWLAVASLIVCLEGCNKTDNTPPPPKAEATHQEAQPAAAVEPQRPTAPASAPATNEAKQRLAEVVTKAGETPPVPVNEQSAQPVRTSTPPPSLLSDPVSPTIPTLASLSQDQVVRGLEEALGKGLQQAVTRLGHDGGFLTNLNVRIPMPEKLQKVETALRTMKQDKLADDFVATMNHAAEQAVPQAGSVFADALKQMTIEDAKSILAGPNDAATQYFQRTTRTNLYARFYPIVRQATQKTGVTAAYKNLMEKASAANVTEVSQRLGSLGSVIGGSFLDKDSLDIDAYVTNKAMDGLFKMVADEEKLIRLNPVARTSDLLQKVFGALKN